MAEFSLGHNVAAEIAERLRSLGHGARTATSLGLARACDHEQLLLAAPRGWTLITSDWKDFRLLHDAWRAWPPALGLGAFPPHAGVLVIPAPDTRRGSWLPAEAAECIGAFLAGAPSLPDALYRWSPSAGWARFCPPPSPRTAGTRPAPAAVYRTGPSGEDLR